MAKFRSKKLAVILIRHGEVEGDGNLMQSCFDLAIGSALITTIIGMPLLVISHGEQTRVKGKIILSEVYMSVVESLQFVADKLLKKVLLV